MILKILLFPVYIFNEFIGYSLSLLIIVVDFIKWLLEFVCESFYNNGRWLHDKIFNSNTEQK